MPRTIPGTLYHQGVRLLERFAQDDRVRIRCPKKNLQVKCTRSLPCGSEFVSYVDAIGDLDGKNCILDWKTTGSRYPEQPQDQPVKDILLCPPLHRRQRRSVLSRPAPARRSPRAGRSHLRPGSRNGRARAPGAPVAPAAVARTPIKGRITWPAGGGPASCVAMRARDLRPDG